MDDLLQLSWAATLFPTWALLALLGVTLVAAGVLGVGIFVTGEPREHGQRALFCICYGVLLTMSASGLVFQLQLVRRLDGLAHVSNAEIIAPLLAAYAGVLLFYLAFTFILPRLVEYDLAALAERPDEEAEAADGVLEAICSQLAPPCLVQQSSTLFQRVNSAMLQAFLTSAAALDGKPRPSASSIAVAPEQPGAREASQAEGAPPPAVRAGAPAGCDLEAGSAREGDVVAVGAFDPSPVLSEYEDLQRELGEWLRQHSGHGCARLQPPDEQRRLGQTHRPPLQRAASHVSVGDLEAGGAEGERAGSADGADGGTEMMAAIRQSGAEGAHHAAEPRAERASRHSAAADLAPPVREAWQAARGAEPPALPLAPDALAAPRHDAPATAAARAQADSGARTQGDGEVPRAPGARASAASEGGAAEVPPSVRHVGVGASLPEPIVARSLSPRMGLRYPAPLSVPPEILSKLRRFVHLKRQIASQVVSAALSAPELLVTQAQAQGQQGGQPIRAQAAKEGGVDGAPDGAARGAAALVRVAEPRAEAACVGVGTAVQRGPAPRQAGRSAAAGNTLAEEEEAEQAAECSSPAVETASTAAPHADSDDETGEDAACWICCEGPRDAVRRAAWHWARRASASEPRSSGRPLTRGPLPRAAPLRVCACARRSSSSAATEASAWPARNAACATAAGTAPCAGSTSGRWCRSIRSRRATRAPPSCRCTRRARTSSTSLTLSPRRAVSRPRRRRRRRQRQTTARCRPRARRAGGPFPASREPRCDDSRRREACCADT